MRRGGAALVAVGLLAAACSGATSDVADAEVPSSTTTASTSSTTTSSTSTTTSPTTTSAPARLGVLAASGERSRWVGTIETEIGFTMWLAQAGNHLFGELTYDTVGEPIIVVGRGHVGSPLIVLREFMPDGQVTGTLSVDVAADWEESLWGFWDDRELVVQFVGTDDEGYDFVPVRREGEYRYRFPPFDDGSGALCCGPAGIMTISFVDADSLVVEFENVRGAPSFNLATIPPTEIPIVGGRAVYDSDVVDPDGAVDCAFTISIYDGFAFVDHIDDRWECGFGMGAGVEGVYLLTDPERWG